MPLSGTLERKFLCGEHGAWERGKGGKGRSGLPSRENSGSLADALFCRIVYFSSSRGSCVKTARQWNDAVVPKFVPCSAPGGRAGAERLGQPPAARREKEARSGRIAAAKKAPAGPLVRPENDGTRCIFSCFFGREAEKWIDRKHGQ